jgi:hypothetical protein
MKHLNIVNEQRQSMATIQSDLSLQTEDEQLKKQLEALLEEAKREGVSSRSGRHVEKNGKRIFVEEVVKVFPRDDNFLEALSDVITRAKFSGTRYFGMIEEQ